MYDGPHQLMPGPPRYNGVVEVAVAYVNLLEERLNVTERELNAMRDRFGHQLWPEQNPFAPAAAPEDEQPVGYDPTRLISELRDQNTRYEAERIKIKELHAEVVANQADTIQNLREMYNDQQAELRKVKEHNSQLINEASGLNTLRGLTKETGYWTVETFNEAVWRSPIERGARLIEEALEAGQVAGVPMEMAKNILLKVYNGPPGVMKQELGGVLICWASMVGGLGFDPVDVANAAMADCWKRQVEIHDKWLTKIKAGISVDLAKVPSGQDDDEAHRTHRTHRKVPSDPRASVGMAIQPSDFERMVPRNYSDTPLTNDQRGMKIIADARDALDAHIQATKDPH